jgi:hypothetical protein
MASDSFAEPLILSGTCTVDVKFGTWAHAETAIASGIARNLRCIVFSFDRHGGVATSVWIACKRFL